eukprot:Skav204011  [mRNA]  locus=scaffold3441:27792:30381:+ [translate_table: standard]
MEPNAVRLAPLKVKALADSKLAVWQREDWIHRLGLAAALEIETVKRGAKALLHNPPGSRQCGDRWSREAAARSSELGAPDYFGDRALLGSEIRSASITALEATGVATIRWSKVSEGAVKGGAFVIPYG